MHKRTFSKDPGVTTEWRTWAWSSPNFGWIMVSWLWGPQTPSSLLKPLEQVPGEGASSWPSHWPITTVLESRAKLCTIPRNISMFNFSNEEESHFSELYLFRTKMTRNREFTVPESLTLQNPAFQEFLLWKEIKPSKFCTGALTTWGLLLPSLHSVLEDTELTLTGNPHGPGTALGASGLVVEGMTETAMKKWLTSLCWSACTLCSWFLFSIIFPLSIMK